MPRISDARVLIVATDGFEEWELFGPREILQERGAEVVLASLKRDPIQATVHDDPGKTIRPDLTIDEAKADDFDALILPGGVRNPDQLRLNDKAIELIRDVRRRGQADRRDLPRPMAAGRSGSAARQHGDQLALDPHRPQERRRKCRRRARGDGRQHRHQPQAGRCRGSSPTR